MNNDDKCSNFCVKIHHNFDEKKFRYLWAKYVRGGNLKYHCAKCLNGTWSQKFSGYSNKDLLTQPELQMDEVPVSDYKALYFCGVSKQGYPYSNYQHNVHFIIIPQEGIISHWEFEDWKVDIENGILSTIPDQTTLDDRFFQEPYNEHYYTCRNFQWMVGFFYPELLKSNQP